MQRGDGGVEVGLGRGVLGHEFLFSGGGELRQFERGPGVGELAFHLVDDRPVGRRIELRDDLPGFHRRIKVGEKFLNDARNLATHGDVNHRIERAAGGDDLRHRAAGHGGRLILRGVSVPAVQPPPATARGGGEEKKDDPFFHFVLLRCTRAC